MKSYSQSSQDHYCLCANPNPGFFIDIGCSIPAFQSNTKLLLEMGWSGICIDIEERSKEWSEYDNVHFIQGDATKLNWIQIESKYIIPGVIDYVSFDVDRFTFDAVQNFLEYGLSFKCATVEHDAYRFGDDLRIPERNILEKFGYKRVRSDVSHNNMPYEDWYIDPLLVNQEELEKEMERYGIK